MARASYNLKAIVRKVGDSKKLRKQMDIVARHRLESVKTKMIEEFIDHPVSREIAAGAGASNTSGTLTGGYGNLFTFIGFPANRRPISDIVNLMKRSTYLIGARSRRLRSRNPNTVSRAYDINYLSEMEIDSFGEAKMPWESGSWIKGIEEGLSGFGSYMYKSFGEGRSKQALQAKKGGRAGGGDQQIRVGSYSPIGGYVSTIIKNFKRNARSAVGGHFKVS